MTGKQPIAWMDLNFEGFAKLAADARLSKYERIGFPDSYRQGHEAAIFADIVSKVPRIKSRGLRVLDVGPGCSDLALMVMDWCREHGHILTLVDSEPMLQLLPNPSFVDQRPGLFPNNKDVLADLIGKIDVIIMYSVFQYICIDADPFEAIDLCLDLLAPSGQALIGDLPNTSMRNRFFSSEAGIAFHHAFTGQMETPPPIINSSSPGHIDDGFVARILARARAAGSNAFVVPQAEGLPMQNRREDVLIWKP